ncbi:hypothetical protein WN944_016088 [Citrus x changshan-huyou]|uniref:Uncharacterized protein n=1 Tax=Citrus x changshan-huyou TaxID=2935761 RepID=A0AAP0M8R7_9ROSI|nr:putative defensin-like protein 20 [Citrus sinensis]XP_024045470.1 putative defensin-like protein 20 [Citrus x clementina]
MAQVKVLTYVLIVALMLCINSKEVVSKSKCCNNHPELGGCKHGVDDDPDQGGKCWTYCVSDCEKGGFCKEVYKNHFECHCYC